MASPSPLSPPAPRPRAVRVLPPPLTLSPFLLCSDIPTLSLLLAEEGSVFSPSLFSPLRPTGRMIAPKGPSRARRGFSLPTCVSRPSILLPCVKRKGGGEGEKDSRSEIRSIGLIGLRRHGLAASAPPIAYNTGGGYDLSPNIRPHLRQKWCASRSR